MESCLIEMAILLTGLSVQMLRRVRRLRRGKRFLRYLSIGINTAVTKGIRLRVTGQPAVVKSARRTEGGEIPLLLCRSGIRIWEKVKIDACV